MGREHPALIESRRKVPHLAGLFADAQPYSPSLLLENDAWEVDLGGARVRVRHPGPGHTPGDLVAWVEEEDVMICGDLVSAGYHVNYEDADLQRLESGLEELWKRRARTYVPGHGAAGGPEVVEAQGDYHRAVARAASSGDVEEGAAKLRRRYPGYRLEELLPQSIERWPGGREA